MKIEPIGKMHTPFRSKQGMPIQPAGAAGVRGRVEVFEGFREGLKDLEGFSHIILIYLFHQSVGYDLLVKPFMDDVERGVFATRAPRRPNPIGLSVVKLESIDEGNIMVERVDMLDGTPVIDIKPFVPEFDPDCGVSTGWLEKAHGVVRSKLSDDRFTD